jgi:hypothetical protein
VLDRYPGFHESAVALGVTYYSLGRIDDAIREWEGILDADPGCEQARMYLRLVGRENDAP